MYKKSINAFKESKKYIPGGVNSPVRSFNNVGGNPVFFKKGDGSQLYDLDGNIYIDLVSSWGPLIFGHSDCDVISSISTIVKDSITFGAPTLLETEIAKKIIQLVPSVEMVRMVNSGTEATMSAIRLARGYTKKDLIIKFEGNYHGHGDSFLIKSGSGLIDLGIPDSLGVTKNIAKDTLVAKYNSISSLKTILSNNKNKVAAIIIEPIPGNMGLVLPKKNFLKQIRELCDIHDVILIFDEVMSGFRVACGGAQELYNIKPDLTAFGKIVGGGLPAAAYGGKKKIMSYLAPDGPVYQAGTLSGNPLAVSAGLTVLNKLNSNLYSKLELNSNKIQLGFEKNISDFGIKAIVQRVGSMMTLFFTDLLSIDNYDDAKKCHLKIYSQYFKSMLRRGIYLPSSQFECMFVSDAISSQDIQKIIIANRESLKELI